VNQKELKEKLDNLTRRRKQVLDMMRAGNSDKEIAESLTIEESTVRKHIEKICDHFGIEQEFSDSRASRRKELMSELGSSSVSCTPSLSQDWGVAPDVNDFYGRNEELATLKTWIVADNCRLVAISGMPGIGKTALSVKLAETVQQNFDFLIWTDLRESPSVEKVLANWLKFLSSQQITELPNVLTDAIALLINSLNQRRCLLVLDNFEAVLGEGDRPGNYRSGYEGYGQLIQKLGAGRHRSCLVINSRENPREIAVLVGENTPVRSLPLAGLDTTAAQEILREHNLLDSEDWGALIRLYRGNPLALKIVSQRINNVYNGKVSEFLPYSIVLDSNFEQLLYQQFKHLSAIEKQIIQLLAQRPDHHFSIQELRSEIKSGITDALYALGERSLIEQVPSGNSSLFTLQPIVVKYVTKYPLT